MELKPKINLFHRLKTEGMTVDGSQCFISEWELVRFIDNGQFGIVYEIVKNNQALGEQRSALKIIELDEKSIKKYKDEIAALTFARNHPHAVSIEDFSELHLDEGDFIRRYILIRMELLCPMPEDGLPEDEVIKMSLNVSNVLTDCHSQRPKILHCDIKPKNILLTENGTYKLSDFGEAKFLDRSRGESGRHGTPFYMAPEMLRMEGYDERSDLYSLGITMYAMLGGGKVPFYTTEDEEADAIRRRMSGEKFPKLKGVRPELLKIIYKLCEMDPDKRYQRASQLNRDLRALVKKKEEEAQKREEAEIARKLREKQKAEAAEKRRQAKQDKLLKKQAERDASLEKRNEEMLLGETLTTEPSTQAAKPDHEATIVPDRPKASAKGRRGKIAIAAACAVVVIAGAAFGIGALGGKQEDGTVTGGQQVSDGQTVTDVQSPEEKNALLEPKTEADRALAEVFSFDIRDEGVVLAKYKGTDTEVEIPAEYNGMPVVEIGKFSFDDGESLISVTIPDSVTSIGNNAFYLCVSLESIVLPDSITHIGDNAFYQCVSLGSIVLPDSIRYIGDSAFYQCGLTEITIPNSVTSIKANTFSYCSALATVTIPNSVTSIGKYAFFNCESLREISIPDSVTSIGEAAFGADTRLDYNPCKITVKAPHEADYYGYNFNAGNLWYAEPNKNVTWVVTG